MKIVRSNLLPNASTFFNNFFDDDHFWNPDFNGWSDTIPAANIVEKEDSFLLELAAPGMKKSDFKIDVNNGMLAISSEKKEEKKEEGERFTRKEFSYNSFTRSFRLPEFVEPDKIEAKYDDGMLRLTLPKNVNYIEDAKKEIIVG